MWVLLLLSSSTFANNLNNIQNIPSQLTQVQLQLKWQHQFQFAGYYAAIEKGFYQDVGLEVILKEETSMVKKTARISVKRLKLA
jgi:ABC-type nitrate/sulfonate/bicarbonate transport system substrate-binding protein